MTRDEFISQLDEFTNWVASEYATEYRYEYVSPKYDEDDHEATITLTFNTGGTWKVPIGIDTDGKVAIVASADVDAYLDLDAGGLYAYLFLEADYRLAHGAT